MDLVWWSFDDGSQTRAQFENEWLAEQAFLAHYTDDGPEPDDQ